MSAPAPPRAGRQEERSRSTRRRVLEATVDCLVERGWSGTTTTLVAERAGVSRGAQLHHYRTKSDLVVAAVEHLAEKRAGELRAVAAGPLPEGDRVAYTLDLLASLFTGPLYAAAIEVWVAARNDDTLRAALVPVEARFGREVHQLTVALLAADERRPGVREAVQATLDLMRGLGVASLLTDDSARRTRVLAEWTRQLARLLRADLDVGRPPSGVSDRATSRSAEGREA
jgi:AcrR family transcriptional regulator